MAEKLLEVKNLKQYFGSAKHPIKAVDGISFFINKGETLGLVGESGSGKSTTGRSIIRLYEPTAGEIIFEGRDITKKMTRRERLQMAKDIQMIFQDPYASLNPRMTIKDILSEPLDIHGMYPNADERLEKLVELMENVGLDREHLNRYPHEFSGGQRQRIGVARVLALDPKFIIADEPISALDVSIQAQVVNLLKDLQRERGLTYLFIAHDLSMVKYISDRLAIMHKGQLVEVGDSEEIYENPVHPYTKSLLSAIPLPDPAYERQRQRIVYSATAAEHGTEWVQIKDNHWVLQ
ncbi:MAG: ATP-binding cassette domain-containing protein [Eubacteriales bacterium]|nr:ATP-binding cassette domain-containing protein [Eubacteriales bacterium]